MPLNGLGGQVAPRAPMLVRVLACVFGVLLKGLEGRPVEVQVDDSPGVPGFHLVGLAAASVKEAKERVRAAIRNSGLAFPAGRRLTVNLAPASIRKEGGGLDLPLAVAVVLAALDRPAPPATAFIGELALDGAVRHVDGVLVAARALQDHGFRQVFVAADDAREAVLVRGLTVYGCANLAAVLSHLLGEQPLEPELSGPLDPPAGMAPGDDLAEVQGQEGARRALEAVAAGGHHLLFSGPPGAGKTMLARCLPGILPPLSLDEALEVAQVRSVLGDLEPGQPLDWRRPFRSPHHTISAAGLVGGGAGLAQPGEISRADRGVLFLDELAEFEPAVLQAIRQPLEQGLLTITRSGGSVTYPARFTLVAATNPCPCGWAGDALTACRCSPRSVSTYQRALSGPLLDRIDVRVTVTRPPLELLSRAPAAEPSEVVRERVIRARLRQHERQGCLNSALQPRQLREFAELETAARRALERWALERGLSARGFHRAWRVARTLADLEGADRPRRDHVLEALGYRLQDRAA